MTLDRARTGLALAGMALAVAGVGLNQSLIVWAAIVVLGVAFAIRFIPRRDRTPESGSSV